MVMLADTIYDDGLDGSLKTIADAGNLDICVCSQEPTSFVEATSTYLLGRIDGVAATGPAAGDAEGRKLTIGAATGGTFSASGTATHYALVNGLLGQWALLATRAIPNPQAVVSGNGFSVPSWDIEFPDPPSVEVISGIDYWLPDNVDPVPFSGYENQGYVSTEDDDIVLKWLAWSDFETSAGVYDWSYFDDAVTGQLALCETHGKRLSLRILSTCRIDGEASMLNIPSHYHSYMSEIMLPSSSGNPYPIYAANTWHPIVAAAFNDFIIALGQRYASSPYIEAVTIHAISNARGEEFILEQGGSPSDLDALDTEWGADEDTMDTWLRGRMDAFKVGFAGYEHKVVWVGSDTDTWDLYMPSVWKAVNDGLITYAWSLGFGNRSGIVEFYTIDLFNDAFGMGVDSNGYQTVNEIPPHLNGRYLGEENEEYGSSWSWKYGTAHSDLMRLRISTLECLRRRCTHIYTQDLVTALDQDLHDWTLLELGRTVDDVPDVWCLLYETDISTGYVAAGAIKNVERWLAQRDVTGGMTVATEFHAQPWTIPMPWVNGTDGSYMARRTNTATGDDRIYFQADEDFDLTRFLRIFVEVVDTGDAEWCLEYANLSSTVVQTTSYTSEDDDAVRTIVFDIDGIEAGGLANGYDFCIRRLSGGDVIARFVRVVPT